MTIGLLIRIFFVLFIAEHFFQRPFIFANNDTTLWSMMLYNFIKEGTMMGNSFGDEYNYFMRLPGYTFFMLPFYKLASGDWWLTYKLMGWFQTMADTLCIYLSFSIARKLFPTRELLACGIAGLYALYPFIIVWTPVAYSEWLAIALLLWFMHLAIPAEKTSRLFLSGLVLGFAVLCRPQIALIVPIILTVLFLKNGFRPASLSFKPVIVIALGVLLSYGWWPARNYFGYGKFILAQDLRGIDNWREDVLNFMQLMFAIQEGWEPQFSQIIHNEPVTIPAQAGFTPHDSLLFLRGTHLASNCSKGFSHWRGYWQGRYIPLEESCQQEVQTIFKQLRTNHIKSHPLNFYVRVPLQNLSKALFKTEFQKNDGLLIKLASILFIYRTFLILAGLVGALLLLKGKNTNMIWFLVILLYFAVLYFYLCFGTTMQCRNIEMRYFLPADILLLFPAGWLIAKAALFRKMVPKKLL